MNKRFLTAAPLLVAILSGCSTFGGAPEGRLIERPSTKINALEEVSVPIDQNPVYKLLVAEMAINRGQTETAVENYLSLSRSLNDAAVAERAVRIAIYAQDLDAARQAAERWIELDPAQTEARQIVAAIFIRQGDVDQAFNYLDEILQSQNPITDQIFITFMAALAREKDIETVNQVTRKIADKYTDQAYAQYLHGSLVSRGDQPQESLDYLDRALKIKEIPDAHAIRAKMLIQLGQREEAVVSLKRAVLSRPGNQQLRLAYARLLVDIKEYERARVEFEKLHLMAPSDPDLLYTLGLLSLEAQRYDDAERYLSRLLYLGKREGEARYYIGRINEARKQYDKAIEWYGKVDTSEYRFDARIRSANLIAKTGKTEEAIAMLRQMAEGSQSRASLVRIYLAKGEILNHAERHHEAIKVYNQALAIIPGNIDLLYARGLTGEKVDNIDMLEKDMRTILETEPDNAHALNALGFTLADRTDRIKEALSYLEKAIEIKPDDPAIIDSYGWVHYRLGNYGIALEYLRKALTIMHDGEIAAHLGEVLWVTGKQKEARQVWQRALEKSPDNPYVIKTMQRLDLN